MANKERLGILGKVGLAAALGLGAVSVSSEANAAGTTCVSTTRSVEIPAGTTKTFKARHAIVTGDVWVDGVRQYDDLAETRDIVALRGITLACRTCSVKAPYGASVDLFKDGTTDTSFKAALGTKVLRQDARNNPTTKVEVNYIAK